MCVFGCVCVCARVCGTKKKVSDPVELVTGGCEQPCTVLGADSNPQREQVLFTAEPQPSVLLGLFVCMYVCGWVHVWHIMCVSVEVRGQRSEDSL